MSKKLKQKKGFTIIEVVLVLAIAGLIFLMVFVVVPQAMAGQRDGERRNAMARVQEALIQYQTNNKSKRNNLPGSGAWTAPADGTFDCTTKTGSGDSTVTSSNNACNFVKNYMNISTNAENTFDDPDGVPYNVVITCNLAESGCTAPSPDKLTTPPANVGTTGNYSQLEGDSNGWTIGGQNPFQDHTIYIVPGGQCSGESVVKSELRHFAVLYRLEGSGVYCGDSD